MGNNPDKYIIDSIDKLALSDISFALYRLPQTDSCHLVLQTEGYPKELDDLSNLKEEKGFVMAPFVISSQKKVLIIKPEAIACGWNEIGETLSNFHKSRMIKKIESEDITPRKESCKEDYKEIFERFIGPLKEGRFRKLVLSRYITEPVKKEFSVAEAFIDACNSYPRMFIYLCHTPIAGTWLGSTPEIFLSGHTLQWHTVALAGTMCVRDEEIPTDWDEKNCKEQKFVADYVRQKLRRFPLKGNIEEKGPYTARAGMLVHRKTDFLFNLENDECLGKLIESLHPTPAVCGLPKEKAWKFITENEGYDRRYYSGIIGWLDVENETNLFVNLRCMEVGNSHARLYAGSGLLESSDIESEWEETNRKLATMKKVLNDENNN